MIKTKTKEVILLLPAVLILFVFFTFPARASDDRNITPVRTNLDEQTLQRGFTIETEGQEIRLGITPNSLGARKLVHVALKSADIGQVDVRDQVLLSRLYSFDVFHKQTVEVNEPIWITVEWDVDSKKGYALKFWNGTNNSWDEVPATIDLENRRMQAAIHLPYAIVGVFESGQVEYTGQASWMDWHGAAMNEVGYGTEVLVKNVDTGAQATTTIVSTGPFVPGRIIDLPREIFGAIADISQGVINVIVHPLA
ncbi:MAG: septal ring lytic transglycosylase RlpA family protein [Candidatus Thermoplasmatota archaeon]|nr:septal ring lytic transglycosylase RlpA family protein [Candidatus Thermoplasmatota archaeon]